MSGIYIHIPFCKQPCSYCNFHFSVSLKNKKAFLAALLKEIDLRKNYLSGEKFETVYFGGGTPSLLSSDELKRIFEKLESTFPIASDAEITLEANPDDLSKNKVTELRTTPVNRLSIGIQSFNDDDLKFLNRAHSAAQGELSLRHVQDAGFENITIDLIYGIPGSSQASGIQSKWLTNLDKVSLFNIPHFSAYCLTIEPKTILDKLIREKKAPDADEADAAMQFESLMDFAEENGYEHYEISNFAKAGYRSRHNTSYWTGKKYIGLGPSAHSYNGISRQWNIANNSLYIQALEKGNLNFEQEILSATDRFNEYIMTSLRTNWGVDRNYLKQNFPERQAAHFEESVSAIIAEGLLAAEKETLRLTRKGKMIADRIISGLFETE
ncbi:MAG TPA: radical SAM family heme chaperone HemW [Chitinophagales bacterium]|nr:radical SAM family heme chaperone HemW [Chitinophagales bacterium]